MLKEQRISVIKDRIKVLDLWERSSVLSFLDPKNWSLKHPLIDQLHIACLLYENSTIEQLDNYLSTIKAISSSHPLWGLLKVLVEILRPIHDSNEFKRSSEFDVYRRLIEIKQKSS